MKRYVLIGAVVLGVSTASLQAGQVLTVTFTGEVSNFLDDLGIFPGVSVNDPVIGTYSYNTNMADHSTDPEWGFFPTGVLTVVIGNWLFQSVLAHTHVRSGVTEHMLELISPPDFSPSIPGTSPVALQLRFIDWEATALSSDALPTGAPDLSVWDFRWGRVRYESGGASFSQISFIITSASLKAGGGACSFEYVLDFDGDGIHDGVDPLPLTVSSLFLDTSTVPTTSGGITDPGGQDLCVRDAPWPWQGVEVCSLGSGPGGPASVFTDCLLEGMKTTKVHSGDCVVLTCGSSVTAEAVTGEVEVELLKGGIGIATVVLPEGNSVTFDGDTLQATAAASNNTTLTLVTPSGDQLPLAPGGAATLPPVTIPAVSTWGLLVLALVLLAGAKVYFNRRRTAA